MNTKKFQQTSEEEWRRHGEAWRKWKRHGENSPLEPPAEVLPYCYLGFRLLGSRIVGEYIFVVSSHHGCDNLL